MIARVLPVAALVVAAVTVSCAMEPSSALPPGTREEVRVLRVVDGDTVHVELDGADVTIRLIGIDTPEAVAPDQPVECFGRRASSYATERLHGRTVELEFDVERTDPFDRTLAYVWVGNELFNETLVREGYALVTTFPPNVRYVERFTAAQAEARASGEGLWGACPA